MDELRSVDRGGIAADSASGLDRLLGIVAADERRESALARVAARERRLLRAAHREAVRLSDSELIARTPCPGGCSCRGVRHTEPFGSS